MNILVLSPTIRNVSRLALALAMGLSARAGADDAIAIRPNMMKGDRWDVTQSMSVSNHIVVKANGEVAQEIAVQSTQVMKFKAEALDVSGGWPTAIRATFDAGTYETKAMGAEPAETNKAPFAGKTIVARRNAEGQVEIESEVEIPADSRKELENLVRDQNGFLPPKPVKVGDTWTADEKSVADTFGLKEGDKAAVSFAVKQIRNVGKRPVATCSFKMSVEGSVGEGLKNKATFDGLIAIDAWSGQLIFVDAGGPLEMSGAEDKPDGQGGTVKIEISGSGPMRIKKMVTPISMGSTGPAPAPAEPPPAEPVAPPPPAPAEPPPAPAPPPAEPLPPVPEPPTPAPAPEPAPAPAAPAPAEPAPAPAPAPAEPAPATPAPAEPPPVPAPAPVQ